MTQSPTPSQNTSLIAPDLSEFFLRRMDDVSARINCHAVGTVKKFYADTQRVDVSINAQNLIKAVNPIPNSSGASDMVVDYPLLVNVPVIFLNGGGAALTFPVAVDDVCLLFFCDRDLDIWLEENQIAPPNSDRLHDMNDAVALVGIRNLVNSLEDYFTGGINLDSWAVKTTGNFEAGTGADGVFTSSDGKTITVTGGIITSIA